MQIEIALVIFLITILTWVLYLYLEKKDQNKKLLEIIQNYKKDKDLVNQASRNLYGNIKGKDHKQNKIDIKSNENKEGGDNSIGNLYGEGHTGNEINTEINKGHGNIINKGTLLDRSKKISNINQSIINDLTMNMN